MLAWFQCCFGTPDDDNSDDEQQPLLAALARRRSFPPPSHVLQRPETLSRGGTLAPHQRMRARFDDQASPAGTTSPWSHVSPPKSATFAPTTPSPTKSDRSSTPKRTIRSAPSSPLIPTHRAPGERASQGKRDVRGAQGEDVSPGRQVVPSSMNALRISPSSLIRPNFKLPAVPETLPGPRRKLILEGPSTVPNSPSPGLTGALPGQRPALREHATAPPTARLQQSTTVGPSSAAVRTDKTLKSGWASLADLRRRLASPALDSQNTTAGSSPVKPSTPTLVPAFRSLIPPLSPPLFGRSVSEPQHLNLHRRLSSGAFAQLVQNASRADRRDTSATREDFPNADIEGFAAHQLPQGRNTDPRRVLIARGRPRSSTVVSGSSANWAGTAAEASLIAGVDVGVIRDRERSESFSRSRRGSARTLSNARNVRTDSRSRNASALSIAMSRTNSDDAAPTTGKTRQRDGSVGRGYPGVAGQGRRGRSPGPSRLGSRNVSTESLWAFENDQQALPAANKAFGDVGGLAPPGLGYRRSGERLGGLSDIAQSGFSHGTPPPTAGVAKPPRTPRDAAPNASTATAVRRRAQMHGSHGEEGVESETGSGSGSGSEEAESPGLQMTARAKRGPRSLRSMASGVSGASVPQD